MHRELRVEGKEIEEEGFQATLVKIGLMGESVGKVENIYCASISSCVYDFRGQFYF